ncbi:MAG: mechanosensitive ion channel family protein [Deltaproteobacteria bacterium]|nr:mechanosensitive ion channel family protein [Deltaproteobacteria bacterium]
MKSLFQNGNLDGNSLKAILIFAAVFISVALVLLIVRKIAFSYFYKWARRTQSHADDIILDSIKHPSVYWAIALSLYIALDTSNFPKKYVDYGLSTLYVLIILSITIAAANISSKFAQNLIEKSGKTSVTGLSRTVIKAFIFAIGILIILNSLGISITPILTALGVGGLAVALALQDTLSNLFSGVHILVERPVNVGDYIKLNSGEEGFIVDIGWRTTRIRELANNIIIIPNNKLAQSIITNYSLPDKKFGFQVKVGVSYDSDPDRIEEILIDEALKSAGSIKGLVTEPRPAVRLSPGFGSSSLDFTLVCHVTEYTEQFDAQHALRKRILKRFRAEGVKIPYPTTTVLVERN